MGFEELEIVRGDVRAAVSPERGAIVTALSIGGAGVLFMNRATFGDPAKNVRGGIPILFPFCGKLEGGVLRAAGTSMPQHGFGRNRSWNVAAREPDRIVCALESDAGTLAVYPFAFRAVQMVSVLERGLRIELRVENRGAAPMPVSPGWHPYFNCPAGRKNEVTGSVAGFTADRLTLDDEFDFGLAAPADGRAAFNVPGLGPLRIAQSNNMKYLQFWSPVGADFICIEPFHGPADTINTEPLSISPGAAETFQMSIELEGPPNP